MIVHMQNSSNHNVLISIQNVGICFKRQSRLLKTKKDKMFWALKDVSFDIKKNETLGIIGRNGAGKSTILSTISGIYAPDKGQIISNDTKVSLLSLQAGFVPYLSGRKNILLNALLLGATKASIEEKMDEIISFSELGDFIDEPVESYSTGMRARLGFSTALYITPDIVLIDEVLGVGDAQFQKKSSDAIKSKLADDLTAVVVSHSENTIRNLCQKVVWIHEGESKVQGTPDEVFKEYNQFFKIK